MRPYRKRERVTVHTRDGQSIDGILVGTYPAALVLSHASRLNEQDPDGPGIPFAGDVIVERTNVSVVERGANGHQHS